MDQSRRIGQNEEGAVVELSPSGILRSPIPSPEKIPFRKDVLRNPFGFRARDGGSGAPSDNRVSVRLSSCMGLAGVVAAAAFEQPSTTPWENFL